MAKEETYLILSIIANQNIVRNLTKLLQGTRFKLEAAPSVDEGIQMAEELLPDAILLDLDSGRKALESCRHLRVNRVLRSTPILMFCDQGDRDLRALGLSAGVDDFINKPFDDIELLSRLRTVTRLNAKRLMVADLTRFKWMASHAIDGYLLLDMSGVIHYANDNAQVLLHLPSDYLGLPFIAVVEQRFKVEPDSAWANWVSDPAPLFLVQPESPTGRAAWIMADALDTMLGAEHHRVVRIKDVTERMSAFQDMRRFHTVVAHKLRTPMSIMFNNLSIIKDKMDMLSTDEIREYIASSITNAHRLVDEIRQILTYIQAPLALNDGESVALNALPGVIKKISKDLKLRKVKLSAHLKLDEIKLALTQEALEMIVHELLENSQKFHPAHDPHIEISLAQTDSRYIDLRVADNGLTLTPEQLSWAWLPYVQGEKDFTGELPGMGLGFPMVATLVWKAGGDLWLRNRYDGPGLVVEMRIPLESTVRKFERSALPYRGAG